MHLIYCFIRPKVPTAKRYTALGLLRFSFQSFVHECAALTASRPAEGNFSYSDTQGLRGVELLMLGDKATHAVSVSMNLCDLGWGWGRGAALPGPLSSSTMNWGKPHRHWLCFVHQEILNGKYICIYTVLLSEMLHNFLPFHLFTHTPMEASDHARCWPSRLELKLKEEESAIELLRPALLMALSLKAVNTLLSRLSLYRTAVRAPLIWTKGAMQENTQKYVLKSYFYALYLLIVLIVCVSLRFVYLRSASVYFLF